MKRYSTLLLAAAFVCLQAHAGESETDRKVDSLRTLIAQTEGEAKLELYYQLNQYGVGNDWAMPMVEEYLREARRQKNIRHEGLARGNILVYLANDEKLDSLYLLLPATLDMLSQNELWTTYFGVIHIQSASLLYSGRTDEALAVAQKAYDLARENNIPEGIGPSLFDMGLAYQLLGRIDEAVEMYRQAIAEFQKTGNSNIGDVYGRLAAVYNGQGQNDMALQICRQWDEYLTAEQAKGENDPVALYDLDSAYQETYAKLHRFDLAETYLSKMEQSPLAQQYRQIRNNNLNSRAVLYHNQGLYKKAIEVMETLYRDILPDEPLGAYQTLSNIALIAFEGGEYKIAAESYKTLREQSDSLRNISVNAQLDELRTTYEVDKLEAQKRARENYLWLAGGIILLLAGLLAVWIVYARRVKLRNRQLFDQIRELLAKEKQAEQALLSTPEESLTRGMQLFRRVSELMQAEKPFTEAEFGRDDLAGRLGTNRAYLTDAIREATGLTFSAYLAQLRLHYALRLLDGQSELTLDAVAVDSGHGSYSAFFRLFVKQYGISPSEYRRLAASKRETGGLSQGAEQPEE